MASVYKRTWAGQDGKERVRLGRRRAPVFGPAAAELQRAIDRLLDGSFQPRVTKRRNPKQLELFSRAAQE